MGTKTSTFVALVLTFMLASALAFEENEKEDKPTPKFIRKLFQKLFEMDNALKEKREAKEPEVEHKGQCRNKENRTRHKFDTKISILKS